MIIDIIFGIFIVSAFGYSFGCAVGVAYATVKKWWQRS